MKSVINNIYVMFKKYKVQVGLAIFLLLLVSGIALSSSADNSLEEVKGEKITNVSSSTDDAKEDTTSQMHNVIPSANLPKTESKIISSPTPTVANNSANTKTGQNVSNNSKENSQAPENSSYSTPTPYVYPTQTMNYVIPTSVPTPPPTTAATPTPEPLDCSYVTQAIISLNQDYGRRGIPLSSQMYKDDLANFCSSVSPCSCP